MRRVLVLLGLVISAVLIGTLWRLSGSDDEELGYATHEDHAEITDTVPRRSESEGVNAGAGADENEPPVSKADAIEVQPDGPYSLVVHVGSVSGVPIEGANVYLMKAPPRGGGGIDLFRLLNQVFKTEEAKASGSTDSQGRCEFSGLAVGRYQAAVFKDGFEALYSRAVGIQSDVLPAPIRVHLRQGHRLHGIVVDKDELPIEGAVVAVLPKMDGVPEDIQTVKQVTDASGRFSFSTLADRKHHLMASADGFATQGIENARVGEKSLRIVLSTGGSIRGRIIDETTGEGIPGASVAMLIKSSFALTKSGPDGTYAVASVQPDESVKFLVQVDGYAISKKDRQQRGLFGGLSLEDGVGSGEVTTFDVQMVPMGILRGQVVDASSGDPVVAARVRVFSEELLFGSGANEALTDESGAYEVTVSGDNLTILCTKDGYLQATLGRSFGPSRLSKGDLESAKDKISVLPGRVTVVPYLELRKGRTIRGIVVDTQGNPVSRAAVFRHKDFRSISDSVAMAFGFTEATVPSLVDGSFVLSGLPEVGDITLNARHPSFLAGGVVTVSDASFEIEGIKIVLKAGGRVRGRVLDFEGRPVERVKVFWGRSKAPSSVSENKRQPIPEPDTAMTDASGNFVLNGVLPGSIDLELDHDSEYTTAERSVRVSVVDGKDVQVTLQCVQLLSLSGVVLDHDGTPYKNATVTAKNPRLDRTTKSDGSGRFELKKLVSGVYEVWAKKWGVPTGTRVSAPAGSSNIVLRLKRKK